jgi:hypothetical protein
MPRLGEVDRLVVANSPPVEITVQGNVAPSGLLPYLSGLRGIDHCNSGSQLHDGITASSWSRLRAA